MFFVWVRSHRGPRPQLWTHNPDQTVDGFWHMKQGRTLAVHRIDAPKTLNELAAMFPPPVVDREEVTT